MMLNFVDPKKKNYLFEEMSKSFIKKIFLFKLSKTENTPKLNKIY